jgi:hypothetical protein
MAVARIRDLVIDSAHPASLARFWAAVLDTYEVAAYDDAELERLRSLGIDGSEDDPTVLVESPIHTLRLWFQRVPEPHTVKNRVHFDIEAQDSAAELDRLIALGATVAKVQANRSMIVLADPEGNEFCLIN